MVESAIDNECQSVSRAASGLIHDVAHTYRKMTSLLIITSSLSHTRTHTEYTQRHYRLRDCYFSNWCVLMTLPLVLPQIQVINVTPCLAM